jgi:subtilisin family serine protease
VEQPGMPNILANRLFLFMEDENGDIEGLARDFKQVYPGDQYGIIGCDKEVKLLVIQIPENERDQIRRTINSQLPNHKFIVFDEEVYELNGNVSASIEDPGWHLSAIHLKQGWSFTKGSPDIKVAIVDDGIQSDHQMFKGRIVDAYNVFTQNNNLSVGVGHGTHTAGLAVGSAENYDKGASGVAPNCKIMPIQVFDNKLCPLSAMVAGVMYALHHDADVVNISIAPSFKGLNVLPVEQQNEIAKTQFHNVAALWARVCKLAAKKRSVLVFAAGNDDILTSIPPENRNISSIVVTSVDKRLYPTVFTNYGPCSDISAPGKDIYSSFPSNTFQSFDGTSMSAPIVAGTIALMKSIRKDLTVEQVRNVLYSTGADVYGWIPPMVLVDKALEATQKGDFRRIERSMHSVPDNVGIDLHSGQLPDKEMEFIEEPTPTRPTPSEDTDYDAIRKQIAEYQKKIRELEKLLPKK